MTCESGGKIDVLQTEHGVAKIKTGKSSRSRDSGWVDTIMATTPVNKATQPQEGGTQESQNCISSATRKHIKPQGGGQQLYVSKENFTKRVLTERAILPSEHSTTSYQSTKEVSRLPSGVENVLEKTVTLAAW